MTQTLPPEAAEAPELEFKTAPAAEAVGTPIAVSPEGVVKAVVSVTGVVDEVKDIIEPGAYTDTLRKRRPKVIRNHTWNEQVGRVLNIEEYAPGDTRLPAQTKDGRPWPKDAGALVATMQYNMATPRGRAAFEDVKFYHESKEAEFSIGYQVPPGASTRSRDGIRRIQRLELFEISDVLFGAASLSMSLDVKAHRPVRPTDDGEGGGTWEPVDTDTADASGGTLEPVDDTGAPPPEETKSAAEDDGEDTDEFDLKELAELVRLHQAAAQDPAAMQAATAYPDGDSSEDAEEEAESGNDEDGDQDTAEDAEETSDDTAAAAPRPEVKKAFGTAERAKLADQGAAMREGGFPIRNATDLKNAIQALGRAKNPAAARRHIIKRARALGLVDKLPESWHVSTKKETKEAPGYPLDPVSGAEIDPHAYFPAPGGGACECGLPADDDAHTDEPGTKSMYAAVERMFAASPTFETKAADPGVTPGDNINKLRAWYLNPARSKIPWGKPGDWAKCVRIAEKHMTLELAHGFCANLHKMATGEWPGRTAHGGKLKSEMHHKTAEPDWADQPKLTEWDPGAELTDTKRAIGPGHDESLEARREAIRGAVTELLDEHGGRHDDAHDKVTLLGTWPDRVIAARARYSDHGELLADADTYVVPYTVEQGQVTLGHPEPVELTVDPVTDVDARHAVKTLTAAAGAALDEAAFAAELLLRHGIETKAGRVLSNINVARLQQAMTALITVMEAAGVNVTGPSDIQKEDAEDGGEPDRYPDTTSPNAREQKTMGALFTAAEYASGLQVLADTVHLATKAFDPDQPRDREGQWLKVGGRVRISGVGGHGGLGTVKEIKDKNFVVVERDEGGRETIRQNYLTVLDKSKADAQPFGKKPNLPNYANMGDFDRGDAEDKYRKIANDKNAGDAERAEALRHLAGIHKVNETYRAQVPAAPPMKDQRGAPLKTGDRVIVKVGNRPESEAVVEGPDPVLPHLIVIRTADGKQAITPAALTQAPAGPRKDAPTPANAPRTAAQKHADAMDWAIDAYMSVTADPSDRDAQRDYSAALRAAREGYGGDIAKTEAAVREAAGQPPAGLVPAKAVPAKAVPAKAVPAKAVPAKAVPAKVTAPAAPGRQFTDRNDAIKAVDDWRERLPERDQENNIVVSIVRDLWDGYPLDDVRSALAYLRLSNPEHEKELRAIIARLPKNLPSR